MSIDPIERDANQESPTRPMGVLLSTGVANASALSLCGRALGDASAASCGGVATALRGVQPCGAACDLGAYEVCP